MTLLAVVGQQAVDIAACDPAVAAAGAAVVAVEREQQRAAGGAPTCIS
jgi:hypothetical protein